MSGSRPKRLSYFPATVTLWESPGRAGGLPNLLIEDQQQAVVQLTPALLERHLQGLTEKLRSGVSGKVREVIHQAIARILVGVDGSLLIEAKPNGLLRVEGISPGVQDLDGGPELHPMIVAASGRKWRWSSAPEE